MIQEAFPSNLNSKNWIPDITQRPKGLLENMEKFMSTSKQHLNQKAEIIIIKEEDINWPNL